MFTEIIMYLLMLIFGINFFTVAPKIENKQSPKIENKLILREEPSITYSLENLVSLIEMPGEKATLHYSSSLKKAAIIDKPNSNNKKLNSHLSTEQQISTHSKIIEKTSEKITHAKKRVIVASTKKITYRVYGKKYQVLSSSKNYIAKGVASWYGPGFHRRTTSSGERYNMFKMTAAHKTLPLSTYVQVTNLTNGRKVIVKVNDRGPFVSNRLIDLSYGAAKKLGMVGLGLAPVSIKAL